MQSPDRPGPVPFFPSPTHTQGHTMRDIAIVAATRTAIGAFQGSLSGLPAPELLSLIHI